jgi:hypothetical protein
MAVAYLQKREWIQGLFGSLRLTQSERVRNAAGDTPEHAGACPCHAFEDAAAADAVVAAKSAFARIRHANPPLHTRASRTRLGVSRIYSRPEGVLI